MRRIQRLLVTIDCWFSIPYKLWITHQKLEEDLALGAHVDSSLGKAELIKDFESLVEELLKEEPNEIQIKELMEKLDMTYEMDSANRISRVLGKMNELIFESKNKKGSYDLR